MQSIHKNLGSVNTITKDYLITVRNKKVACEKLDIIYVTVYHYILENIESNTEHVKSSIGILENLVLQIIANTFQYVLYSYVLLCIGSNSIVAS